MSIRRRLPYSVAMVALLGAGLSPAAWAQQTAAPAPAATPNAADAVAQAGAPTTDDGLNEIVVVGMRASLQSAQEIRMNSTQIVDSIVAEDIGKFPDNTVGDALQRITGVQITRAAGEASSVLVRGLPNVTTEIDGRDIFTGVGRSVALSDIPAELVSGLDVFKTLSPEQLEGGIAGTINIRLRRPFDFDGLEVAGSARGVYGDQRGDIDPNASVLVSDRWNTGIGEVGALVSVSYQKRRYLDETAFNYVSIANAAINPATGQAIQIPQTTGDIANLGDRQRIGANFSGQWKPNNDLEFYVDASDSDFQLDQSAEYFIGIPGAGALQSYTLIPGTNEVASLSSLNNFTLTSDQAYRDHTNTVQIATGTKWTPTANLKITSDLAYTHSKYTQEDLIVDTRFNAPTYSVDFLSNGTPNSVISGVDLKNPANYYLNQLFDNYVVQTGNELAYRADASYATHLPFLTNVTAGFRLASRDAESQATNGNGIAAPAGSAISAASLPGFGTLSPAGFLSGDRDLAVTQWYNASSSYLFSHADEIRALFNMPAGKQAFDPTKYFKAQQDSYAGYVKADYAFDLAGFPVTGDFGMRFVATNESITGYELVPDSTGTIATGATPQRVNSKPDYFNGLPSFNGKIGLTDTLFFRVSAGKTVTFPDFSSLNPSLSLNSPGPTLIGTGTSGNAHLAPITSTNVDTALEWFFAPGGSATATLFHRDIKGYIQTYGVAETVNNVSYLVSVPESSGSGMLQGVELGYQQFYDFLPDWLRGIGTQINGTYIDSYTMSPASVGGTPVQQALANVSRYSFNVVGMYERGPYSFRLAYNWRSSYVIAFNAGGLQPQTIMSKPYGDLGLSASYEAIPGLTFTLDIDNLTGTVSQNYFTNAAYYPRDTDRSDRTFQLGVRYKM